MNAKTYLVSLHRRYKRLEYHHREQAGLSTDLAQRIGHEARASVYSAVADDLLEIIDNADDFPHNTKRPASGNDTDEPKGDGFSTPHHPEG